MIDFLLIRLVRFALWLRYRVRVRGLADVLGRGRKGILFLPNHPGLIDPIIIMSRLYPAFRVHPLADREQIDRFFIRNLARRAGTLPIPDLSKAGHGSTEEVRRAIDECVRLLRDGESLVLYPAGRIYRQYLEDLRSASAVESILRALPDVRVVLVRTRGVWGSGFTWASGQEPSVSEALRKGIRGLLASGVFFAPRREVTLELFEPDDLPRDADRNTLNRYMEAFYNEAAPPNTHVPYSIWERGGVRQVPEPAPARMSGDPAQVPEATRGLVRAFLEDLTGASDFTDDSRLAHDLGMDSLSALELATWLQKEFGFAQSDLEALQTVGDVMLAAFGESTATRKKSVKPPPAAWFERHADPVCPDDLSGVTLCEAFLRQAERDPDGVVVADPASGARTYRELVRGVLALRPTVEALPGERVGVMMPASVGAHVLYLTALFAGKTPVMVNWTLGGGVLAKCMAAVGVERILTSRALVARLQGQGVAFGELESRFVCVEEVAAGLGRAAKFRAWLGARFSWASLRTVTPSPVAAVLFTSGSESLPKAVPLTHANILTNIGDALDCFRIQPDDVILATLPPFHAFGLTVSTLLPLCVGLRSACYPNPTDGGALGQTIDAYKATILVGTPTFLHGIVRASSGSQLASLRLVVSGAETCTPRVYKALAARCPQTVVLEGYGVTECSPVISVNREEDPQPGSIGTVVGAVESVLTDPDLQRRVAPGEEGMLLVRGPSVFDGYLEYDGPSPFVAFEGKSWYRTGDLVAQDPSGRLFFRGRLKRFVKLGGEMISLGAVESALDAAFADASDEGPVLAVAATPSEDRPELVLFTSKDVDRQAANQAIRDAGLSGLHNIRRVIHIDELPLLGTGKTDYRELARLL